MEGRNSRLDGIHAAVLNVKLKYVEQWTAERRKNADLYRKHLQGTAVVLPGEPQGGRHVYHLFVIQVENREELSAHLAAKGISTAVHYPTPLPFLPCYAGLGHTEADFPRSAAAANRILSLPMYAELSEDQIQYVANSIKEFYA